MADRAKGRGAVAGGGQGGRAAKAGSYRKGAAAGSGGRRRKGLEGRGATPPAQLRKGHPAQKRAQAATRRAPARDVDRTDRADRAPRTDRAPRSARRDAPDAPELVAGRNPVVEALRARIPALTLYIAAGLDADERVREARAVATKRGLPVADLTRQELDRLVDGAPHQGLALAVPAYRYSHPDDLLARATEAGTPLLVALDGVTDPRNLGAVVRSAAAFGAHGVVIPERRAAGMTATAWKTSAGAAARLPVARATNMTRTLQAYGKAGLMSVGLAADGEISIDELEASVDPLVLVVGSEGRGLSRLVGEQCDLRVRIPMAGPVESLNAGVAAGVALAEIARRRRG